jgi:hypothetical protein
MTLDDALRKELSAFEFLLLTVDEPTDRLFAAAT